MQKRDDGKWKMENGRRRLAALGMWFNRMAKNATIPVSRVRCNNDRQEGSVITRHGHS